ncbi:MAG: hypothetical protein HC927_07965 [Deltaproteobacteria bacterium]|nr:hypothetical protein [Deltaproteobacteria bacterium]
MQTPIHIAGAGATGSWTALALSKLGFGCIEVWDFDRVEIPNVGVQVYNEADVGEFKATALKRLVPGVRPTVGPYEPGESPPRVLVLGVDTLAARRSIVDAVMAQPHRPQYVIDVRLGALAGAVLTALPHQSAAMQAYRETLCGDEISGSCGLKGSPHMAMLAAAVTAHTVLTCLRDTDVPAWVSMDFQTAYPSAQVFLRKWAVE